MRKGFEGVVEGGENKYVEMEAMEEGGDGDVEGVMGGAVVNGALVVVLMALTGVVDVLPGVDFPCLSQSKNKWPANEQRMSRRRRRRRRRQKQGLRWRQRKTPCCR